MLFKLGVSSGRYGPSEVVTLERFHPFQEVRQVGPQIHMFIQGFGFGGSGCVPFGSYSRAQPDPSHFPCFSVVKVLGG